MPAGFEWIDCRDAEDSVLSFLRRPRAGPPVLVVCNFTPVPRANYVVGVPAAAATGASCSTAMRRSTAAAAWATSAASKRRRCRRTGASIRSTLTLPPLGDAVPQARARLTPMPPKRHADAGARRCRRRPRARRHRGRRAGGRRRALRRSSASSATRSRSRPTASPTATTCSPACCCWRRDGETRLARSADDAARQRPLARRVRRRRRSAATATRSTAWVDHFLSWRHDFARRVDAEDMRVAALVGAELIDAAARARAAATTASGCRRWAGAAARQRRELPTRCRRSRWTRRSAALADALSRPQPRDDAIRPSCRSSSTASGRASAPGTRCSRARARREPGAHGTFATARRGCRTSREMGFDVLYLPPIHPIGRDAAARAATTRSTPAPDDVGSPWAIGAAEGGHKAIHPELGTLEDFRRAGRSARASSASRSRSTSPSSARPTIPRCDEHPRVVPPAARRHASSTPRTRRRSTRTSTRSTSRRDDWRGALGRARRASFEFWIGAGRAHLPRRQPAHQAVRVLGVADRRGQARAPGRDLPGRGVHPAEGDAPAGQARLHASRTPTSPGATPSRS